MIVDLLVTDIVALDSDSVGGGSASHLPGLVVMSPADTWTMDDFAETIVHEATHLALFVLDMVHRLYTLPASDLDRPDCYVVSAVKVGVPRPLDKALHSAVHDLLRFAQSLDFGTVERALTSAELVNAA